MLQAIAIIGAGPAGFYTAQHLLKNVSLCAVHMFEKLPTPYGLIRYGVAPDHPEVKNVIHKFEKTAADPRFSFYGNVKVGQDVRISDFLRSYKAVIVATGAQQDKKLGIIGENLPNVVGAKQFVDLYNGFPDTSERSSAEEPTLDLSCESAVIVGQGNVALDVARVLLMPLDELRKTDVTEQALDAISRSNVKHVHLVGRRGPIQAAFTTAEFREMTKLSNCSIVLHPGDFSGVKEQMETLPRPRRRLVQLMLDKIQDVKSDAKKQIHCHFCLSPHHIVEKNSFDKCFVFKKNTMMGAIAVPTEEEGSIDCGLILRSIGYMSEPFDQDIPFDMSRHVIPNHHGRVAKGLYCSGWIKRGPVGVIVDTLYDAQNTAASVVHDLPHLDEPVCPPERVLTLLKSRGIQVVSFSDWQRIDQFEVAAGRAKGKPREKVTSVSKMLELCR